MLPSHHYLGPFLMFQGCHDTVVELLQENVQWVIVAALVIAFLQVRLQIKATPLILALMRELTNLRLCFVFFSS